MILFYVNFIENKIFLELENRTGIYFVLKNNNQIALYTNEHVYLYIFAFEILNNVD
jgi:hypothetical protein